MDHPSVDPSLIADMVSAARTVAGAGADHDPAVLTDRPDGVVIRAGELVVKAHSPGTDPEQLATRLRIARAEPLRSLLLTPCLLAGAELATQPRDRLITVWPAGTPLTPEEPQAPWQLAGALLAGLHNVDLTLIRGAAAGRGLPLGGAPARVARALARLHQHTDPANANPAVAAAPAGVAPAAANAADAEVVRAAAALLPKWAYGQGPPPNGRPRVLTHGDWHLGQLAQLRDGQWRLLDIDDLGLGDPAWDLARPAAWYAIGLMLPSDWREFLDGYRAAGGVAVAADSDPWPALDIPARALTVQSAALAVAAAHRQRRPLDEWEQPFVDACHRIAALTA